MKVRTRYSTPLMVVVAKPSGNSGSTMSPGIDTVAPPMRAVRTRSGSATGASVSAFIALDSRLLTSPRLLIESSRRSSWLYCSLVIPIHTQVPMTMTVVTTPSAETTTIERRDRMRLGSPSIRYNRSFKSTGSV